MTAPAGPGGRPRRVVPVTWSAGRTRVVVLVLTGVAAVLALVALLIILADLTRPDETFSGIGVAMGSLLLFPAVLAGLFLRDWSRTGRTWTLWAAGVVLALGLLAAATFLL